MDHSRFWSVIETAKQQHSGDPEAQATAVCETLKQFSAADIIAFDMIYDEFRFRSYSWNLWGAAFLMNGGCSDDGFEYFRAWLISRGRVVFERALLDPDSLADEFDPSSDLYELESLFYAPLYAYEAVVGEPMPPRERNYPELRGERWSESDLETRFPLLAAKLDESR